MANRLQFADLLSNILGDEIMNNSPECFDDNIESSVEEDFDDGNIFIEDVPATETSEENAETEVTEDTVDEETTSENETPEEPRRVGMFKFNKNNHKNRINTTQIFDNTNFFNGGVGSEDIVSNAPLAISPVVEDQYDYSVSEDIVLLQDRKDTTEIIYDIYIHAPFAELYQDKTTGIVKIPKEDIPKVFYYVKDKLNKRKKVSAFETVIAINEFFEFNYDYIIKKVVSSKMMSEILEDYYQNMGMKERIDELSTNPLF